MTSPQAIYWRVALLIGLAMLLLASLACFVEKGGSPNPFLVGPMLGTMMQLVVIAAVWSAVGPGHWLVRLPLSLVWACLMGVALAWPLSLKGSVTQITQVVLFMAILWLLTLAPAWIVAQVFGLRLRHQPTYVSEPRHRIRQFGIGQLMIFTTCIAVLLGGGRLILANEQIGKSLQYDWAFNTFLILAQIVMSLPLIIAALMPRNVPGGVTIGLLLMVGVTLAEIPLVKSFTGGNPEDKWIFGLLNLMSAVWVLVFAAVVRWSDYHFGVPVKSALVPVVTENLEAAVVGGDA